MADILLVEDKDNLRRMLKMTLEQMISYIQDDELVEVTPKSIRMRKVVLRESDRKRSERGKV